MEMLDAVTLQMLHLLDRDGRGNQSARIGIIVEPVETMREPVRDARAATLRHPQHLRETRDRQDAGHDRRLNASGRTLISKTQEYVRIEKELRDRARRTGVELRLQIVELEARARRFGMYFGIGGDGDFEI